LDSGTETPDVPGELPARPVPPVAGKLLELHPKKKKKIRREKIGRAFIVVRCKIKRKHILKEAE